MSFFAKPKASKLTKSSRKKSQSRRFFESLEERRVLAAYLFVDFGDGFAGGALNSTIGALRDIDLSQPADSDDIFGPELSDSMGGTAAGTAITLGSAGFSAAARAQLMAIVRRAYKPLDIEVIELTTTPQLLSDGRTVAAATSIADVITTLRGGNAAFKDSYVFNVETTVDPGGANENILNSGGGTSPPHATSDLNTALNNHDDVAIVYANFSGTLTNNAINNTSHEAGHTLGLRHSLTNSATDPNVTLLHQLEIMSYLNTNATTSSTFMRYPVIRGDGNSPPGATPTNYDDLEARTGDSTPFDQLATDANVGANPLYTFVSGTGAHDRITITNNGGGTATVTIEAFGDAAFTTPINVPGPSGNSFTYIINLDRTILIYGGDSNDQFIIDGNLGVNVEIDGMLGTDRLLVNAFTAAAAYTPDATAPISVDFSVFSFGGSIAIAGNTISFLDFETASSVTVQNSVSLSYVSAGGADSLTLDVVAGLSVLTGSVAGTAIVPLQYNTADVSQLIIDAANNDTNDNDSFTVLLTNGNPIPFFGISYFGGDGTNSISATADANFSLSDVEATMLGLGSVFLTDVSIANLTGGASGNNFDVSGWTGTGFLSGGGGTNTVSATADVDYTLTDINLSKSDGMSMILLAITEANLTGGVSANSFDVTGWTGTGTLNGAGDDDTVVDTGNDVDFVLADIFLLRTGFGALTLTSIEIANLTGGASDNIFDVSTWTGTGSLDGAGGTNTVLADKDENFVLADTLLIATDGMSLALTSITVAQLSGGIGTNTFTVSNWTGTGSLDGNGGILDEVISTKNVNYVLTDTSLTKSDGMSLTLTAITVATLTGGGSSNTFNVSGWTGGGTLDGAGNVNDTIVSVKDADIVLTNSSITASDGLSMAVANIEVANLTGGGSDNTFDVGGWTKKGSINGAGGSDTFISAKNVDYTASDVQVTSTDGMSFSITSIENINLTGGASANNFFITPSTTAVFNIAGLAPGFGGPVGDKLKIDFTGTTGKHLVYSGPPLGNGYWEFANRLNVNFTSIEDLGFEGNVKAVKSGATLTLTGDALNNGVAVTNGPNGTVLVTGLGTKINGGTAQVAFSGIINVVANMNDGDDFIMFNNLNLYSINVNGGNGDDAFQTGSGVVPDFNDPMSVADAIANGSLSVRNALTYTDNKGNDSVFLTRTFGTTTVANWNISTGEGQDTIEGVWNSSKAVTVNAGSGNDIVNFDRHTASDVVVIDGVTGNDQLTLTNGDYLKDAKLFGGSGLDRIVVDTNLLRASLFIDSGSESDTVFVGGNSITKDLTIYTGHGYDTIFIGKHQDFTPAANTVGKLTLDTGSESDFVSFGPNNFTDFFAVLGSGDDLLTFDAINNITNKGTLDGGSGNNKVHKTGNPNLKYVSVNFF